MNLWWTPEHSGIAFTIAGIGANLCWLMMGVGTGLASQGRAQKTVMSSATVMAVIGAAATVAGLIALLLGQPSMVVRPLMIGGGLTCVLGVIMALVAGKRYTVADQRKLAAAALRT